MPVTPPIPDAVTAKRAIWGIRVLLYGTLALAAALLLLTHRGESAQPPVALAGETAAHDSVSAVIFDGRVYNVLAYVHMPCPAPHLVPWRVYEGHRGAHFVQRGDRVGVRATVPWDDRGEYVKRLRLDARRTGTRLSGTIEADVTPAGSDEVVCGSGKVAFSAHE